MKGMDLNMRKRFSHWLLVTMAALVVLCCQAVTALAADSPVKSITVINDMALYGEQMAAVAIEYDKEIDLDSLTMDTYDVQALVVDTDGEVASAPVKCVYTNNCAEMDPTLVGQEGKFVIVEFHLNRVENKVGRKISTYFYDEEGERKSVGYWYVPLDSLLCTVTQKADIQAIDGTVYEASQEAMKATDEINLKIDEFQSLILNSEADGTDLHILYHLPENYDPTRKYPMIIQTVGGGTSYWEKGGSNNYGASIAFDNSATAWLNAKEDIIIASVHTRFDLFNGTPPIELIQATKYFKENFAVDSDRVYMTGNSFGTIMVNRTLRMEPDLYAGAILCNGNLGLGEIPGPGSSLDTDPEAIAEALADSVISQKIGLWFCTGRNDPTAKSPESIVPYEALKSVYAKQGMSEEEIDQILRISIFENAQMNAIGITNYHQATRYSYYTQPDEMIAWMLKQNKADHRKLKDQSISVDSTKITKTYGDKAFYLKAASDAKNAVLTYTSSDEKVVTVSAKGKVSIKGCGVAKIKICAEAEGYQTAKKTVKITVLPAQMKAPVLKAEGNGKITVSWKKNSCADRYEIQYSTNKNFNDKTAVTILVKDPKTTSKTVKSLKAKKTYYVRIRAVANSDGGKVEGKWSSAASCKVK
ncbi:MAG: prolyl oligopeptidase family serine peptidase [Clostridiales bacterium]|nr:prolyl oligopeptidase family serine peptidase [Clostridiales bacterium]